MKKPILTTITLAFLLTVSHAQKGGVADSAIHPYAHPAGGRDSHRLANKPINQLRLYDFYQRQADYYLDNPKKQPKIIPAFPGLDGGKHGHWGKFNQNSHRDGRWNEIGFRSIVAHQMPGVGSDAVALHLNTSIKQSAAFVPTKLNVAKYWQGGFLRFDPYRWGTSRGAKSAGRTLFTSKKTWSGTTTTRYVGYHHYQDRAVFHYLLGDKPVYDTLAALPEQQVFKRTLILPKGSGSWKLPIFRCANKKENSVAEGYLIQGSGNEKEGDWLAHIRSSAGCKAKLTVESGFLTLVVPASKTDQTINVYFTRSTDSDATAAAIRADKKQLKLATILAGSKNRWKAQPAMSGTRAPNARPYVVDDIPLPFDNKSKSLLFFTGIAFDTQGAAYICSLTGDVWKVTGLDKTLKNVVWKKIASGLNQPLGMKMWDGKLYVQEREQVTILEDTNGDDEIDFYRMVNNKFYGLRRASHTTTYGLGRDKDNFIYCIGEWKCWKLWPDGSKAEIFADGLRNCMAIEVLKNGIILAGSQEGNNTPASSIFAVQQGEKYGFHTKGPISPPMCYVPRGIDNSTGGLLEVSSDRWGPLGNDGLIGLSFGYGSWYSILIHPQTDPVHRKQAATVPMEGDFLSGVLRAAVNPVDGQVYTVGLDGWGDYALQDGCFHRIRFTGKTLYKPIGYQTFDNGIRVNFPVELDASSVQKEGRFFAQMWDYRNTKQYGSPEFSVLHPDQVGHDPLNITSAHLLADKKSVFFEIPKLQSAMQMHLRMHLKAADGNTFATDLFPTIIHLGKPRQFAGAAPVVEHKNRTFTVKGDRSAISKDTVSGEVDPHARKVEIKTIPGMKYDKASFKVKAGESIALVIDNVDSMSHNIVIVKPGAYKKVGAAAFNMLNDPDALKKSYVPDDRTDVVAFSYVVEPKRKHTTYFKAPETPGTYPYMCTFPGHWQIMKGEMIVE